jgi:hypothetical protein
MTFFRQEKYEVKLRRLTTEESGKVGSLFLIRLRTGRMSTLREVIKYD